MNIAARITRTKWVEIVEEFGMKFFVGHDHTRGTFKSLRYLELADAVEWLG